MPLDPLRIGGTRGRSDGTLANILDAIAAMGDIATGLATLPDILLELQSLNTAVGTLADCSSGQSVIGLLCSLNDSLGGEVTPIGDPPVFCPGYSASNPFVASNTWFRPVSELVGPSPDWYLVIPNGTFGDTAIITWDWAAGESTPQLVSGFEPSIPLSNYCVAYTAPDSGYFILADLRDSSDDSLISSDAVKNNEDPGTDSDPQPADAGQYLVIRAHHIGGPIETAPTATVWIMEGAHG